MLRQVTIELWVRLLPIAGALVLAGLLNWATYWRQTVPPTELWLPGSASAVGGALLGVGAVRLSWLMGLGWPAALALALIAVVTGGCFGGLIASTLLPWGIVPGGEDDPASLAMGMALPFSIWLGVSASVLGAGSAAAGIAAFAAWGSAGEYQHR